MSGLSPNNDLLEKNEYFFTLPWITPIELLEEHEDKKIIPAKILCCIYW